MPPFDCVAQVCESVEETPGDPISRRGHATERLASISLSLPSEENLVTALKPHRPKRSLLHMDIRPDNVLVKQGRIEAFIGWFNALIGDASLELCRVAEYGLLTPEFVEGYGPSALDELPTAYGASVPTIHCNDARRCLLVGGTGSDPWPPSGR